MTGTYIPSSWFWRHEPARKLKDISSCIFSNLTIMAWLMGLLGLDLEWYRAQLCFFTRESFISEGVRVRRFDLKNKWMEHDYCLSLQKHPRTVAAGWAELERGLTWLTLVKTLPFPHLFLSFLLSHLVGTPSLPDTLYNNENTKTDTSWLPFILLLLWNEMEEAVCIPEEMGRGIGESGCFFGTVCNCEGKCHSHKII